MLRTLKRRARSGRRFGFQPDRTGWETYPTMLRIRARPFRRRECTGGGISGRAERHEVLGFVGERGAVSDR